MTQFENLFTPVRPSDQVRQFLVTLWQRRNEGVLLRRADVAIGTWKAQEHYCFDNVDKWVSHRPQHKRVDGFLMFNYLPLGLRFVRFTPHCVIEVENGSLVDITPHEASADYPFIRHTGTADEFIEIHRAQGSNTGLDLIV
jgi:hypothetical protein